MESDCALLVSAMERSGDDSSEVERIYLRIVELTYLLFLLIYFAMFIVKKMV